LKNTNLGGNKMSFFEAGISYFQKGGYVMYPLLLCSIMAMVIAIERFIYYRGADSGEEFADELMQLLDGKKWDDAYNLALNTKGEAAKVAAAAMDRGMEKPERIETFAGNQAERALDRMEQYLPYLGVIIMLSPTLGLLGTITGMMSSFNALDMRVSNPMAVTAGIAEALITTVFGLCISVVAICIHTYFGQKLKRMTVDIEESTNAIIDATGERWR
jgi:biopolymer transport protein ExbB